MEGQREQASDTYLGKSYIEVTEFRRERKGADICRTGKENTLSRWLDSPDLLLARSITGKIRSSSSLGPGLLLPSGRD